MLSAALVRLIESHAEDLARHVVNQLHSDAKSPSYRRIPADVLRSRVYDVYHNLGAWAGEQDEATIAKAYEDIGRTRALEGIPLSEVVYASLLIKEHLLDHLREVGFPESAVEVYAEEELSQRIGRFFDKSLYHVVRGYEAAARPRSVA
jgi:hypothetical protein